MLADLRVANAMMDDAVGATTKADAIEAAMDELADAGLLVGVDITPPGIEIEDDDSVRRGPPTPASLTSIFLTTSMKITTPDSIRCRCWRVPKSAIPTSKTDCLDIGDGEDGTTNGNVAAGAAGMDCDDPTALADVANAFTAPTNAYYTLWGTARDKAGNSSETVSHTFVVDAARPQTATPLAAPGSIDAGEVFQIASFLNDDLSIRDYYVTANFAGDIELGFVHPTVVDAFDADPLTYRNVTVAVDVETYAGVSTDTSRPLRRRSAPRVSQWPFVTRRQQGATPYVEASTTGFTVGAVSDGDNFDDDFSVALSAIDAVCVA